MAGEVEQPAEAEATANGAAAFAKKAKDLEALRTAVIDAANVGAGLWLSYLFLLFYLAVAAGGVTHRNLLFEDPVKLPFLNVDLPLIGFFVLGPGIFLIVHAYVLLHFVLFADKVGAFHAELQAQINDDDIRARLRRQLPSNIFVQFLAGPREVRTGLIGFLLRLIAQISLVVGPLALLVFFQLQFLPYHQPWWQRLAVVADLVLLWTLWPSVARGEITRLGWRDLRRWNVAAPALASLFPILLVFSIATFPGEWLDTRLPSVKLVPTKLSGSNWASMGWTSLHELLVMGEPDLVARKPTSPWSNRLVLPNVMTDRSKSGSDGANGIPLEALSLRGRRLEAAVLVGAHLRNADFTAARLQGADLSGADLEEAHFECAESNSRNQCAQLENAKLDNAQLNKVSLKNAELEGASLQQAQLQDAVLDGADLEGAILLDAQLRGASLLGTDLQGASLLQARLQGASLTGARLQGAVLVGAQLQGADLGNIRAQGASLNAALQGASLSFAHLEGASLAGAQLQGAVLTGSNLQGASLDNADLRGASLEGAELQGASLVRVFVWRANMRYTKAEGARVVNPETGPSYPCPLQQHTGEPCKEWSAKEFAALTSRIEQELPEGERRDTALQRIGSLAPPKSTEGEELDRYWTDLVGKSPPVDAHEKTLAEWLKKTGCDVSKKPYIIRQLLLSSSAGLLQNIEPRFPAESAQPAVIAAAFLDEEHCPGARGLSEEDKAKLREIRDRHPPAPPRSPAR